MDAKFEASCDPACFFPGFFKLCHDEHGVLLARLSPPPADGCSVRRPGEVDRVPCYSRFSLAARRPGL